MPAIDFIERRAEVQADAQAHITEKLKEYRVETRGVYIQDVVFPDQLVQVLTAREIANQQQQTFTAERDAQEKRLDLEASRGRADMQSELAKSSVGIDIAKNKASGVQAEADGESYRLEKVGRASAVKTEAEGLAIAKGLNAQQEAVGRDQTAFINVVRELSQGTQRFMPENLALNLGDGGLGGLNALVPMAMRRLSQGSGDPGGEPVAAPKSNGATPA
jgi:regulator of protease activity HflC (stomatin/prohibitin superfamily)